jgi:hypothetical protein
MNNEKRFPSFGGAGVVKTMKNNLALIARRCISATQRLPLWGQGGFWGWRAFLREWRAFLRERWAFLREWRATLRKWGSTLRPP